MTSMDNKDKTFKTRQDKYREECWNAPLIELGNMLFTQRDPKLKLVAEEVLAQRISANYASKPVKK